MPRTADHDARRRQIADAVGNVIAESGIDAATVARVAARAGVSVGLVQHYFRSKDELLLFAYQQVVTDIGARVRARIAEGEAARRTISAVVQVSLLELLPLDGQRCDEFRVTCTFLGRSVDNVALADVARGTSEDIRAQLAVAVSNGKECGEVEESVDARLQATRMLALVDGLAHQLYLDPERPVAGRTLRGAAENVVKDLVGGVFTGECRHYR